MGRELPEPVGISAVGSDYPLPVANDCPSGQVHGFSLDLDARLGLSTT